MNPYERRVIHSALQNDKFVETHSEGEEPFIRVVVTLKKSAPNYKNNTNRGYNKDYNRNYKKDNNYVKESNKEKDYYNQVEENTSINDVKEYND
jgi:spoIIIJ-associated protein